MNLTSIKTTFEKSASKTLIHRDMNQFDKFASKHDLIESLKKIDVFDYEIFENILDKHAQKKKRAQRVNSKPYVTKAKRKAIMKRSESASK